MLVGVLWALIWIAVVVLIVMTAVWAIESIVGVAIPPRIKQIGAVIIVLICLLIILSMVPLPEPVWRWR